MGEPAHKRRTLRCKEDDDIYLHEVTGHLCRKQAPGHGGPELQHHQISHTEVQAWLHPGNSSQEDPATEATQQGGGPPSPDCSCQPHSHGFRLLICERGLKDPPIVYLGSNQMQDVLDQFALPPETLSFLHHNSGGVRRYQKNTLAENKSSLILKAYEKGEIGNFVLSLTYDHEKLWTDALIVWTDQTYFDERVKEKHLSRVLTLLRSKPRLWSHPLGLPLVAVTDYMYRAELRRDMLYQDLVNLDYQLGVNQSGGFYADISRSTWPAGLDFKLLTSELHSTNNRLVFVRQACLWARKCFEFLSKVEADTAVSCGWNENDALWIRDLLEHQISVAQSCEDTFQSLTARCASAMSVLFNASSQRDALVAEKYSKTATTQAELARVDNQLNIKIATSTKRDSIAVVTFTFLTALFLPGTFVSSLFSITMVDWLPAGDDSASSNSDVQVSSLYWVYWVVTIPLTLAVMGGWYGWYRYANERWLKEAGIEDKTAMVNGSRLA